MLPMSDTDVGAAAEQRVALKGRNLLLLGRKLAGPAWPNLESVTTAKLATPSALDRADSRLSQTGLAE